MNDFLNLTASLASIFAVPLAVYLFFLNQPLRRINVRGKIVKSLLKRILEGRSVEIGEIIAAIKSHKRGHPFSTIFITVDSVIIDLIEKIGSSPLEEEKKTIAIRDLLEKQFYLKDRSNKKTPYLFSILVFGFLGLYFSKTISNLLMALADGKDITNDLLNIDLVNSFLVGAVVSIVAITIVFITSNDN